MTAFLTLSDVEAWGEVQRLCQSAFPHCTDKTDRGSYVPHLTVGQVRDEAGLAPIERAVRRWRRGPIECEVGELCLISREGQNEPFLVHWRVPLGGGGAMQCTTLSRCAWLPGDEDNDGSEEATTAADYSGEGAAASVPAKVRVTLASNSNRGNKSVVLVESSFDISDLSLVAKNKLRLKVTKKSAFSFFRETGELLQDGDILKQDEMILTSRGEEFVGKKKGSKDDQPMASTEPASSAGYVREWVGEAHCKNENDGAVLRIMSWNILAGPLAQGIAAGELGAQDESKPFADGQCGVRYYSIGTRRGAPSHKFLCDHRLLKWDYRAPLVAREILSAKPTAIFLQEVDHEQLRWLRALLGPRGYIGVCVSDLEALKCRGVGGDERQHGVALFWDTSRLEAVGEAEAVGISIRGNQVVLMQRLAFCGGDIGRNDDETGGTFVLATTHLKHGLSQSFEEVRAEQASDMLDAINRFIKSDNEPVLLGCDLNSHPTSLLVDNGNKLEPLTIDLLTQRGDFRCGYSEAMGTSPPFTYWAGYSDREVKVGVDHILIRGGGIRATRALQIPDHGDVAASACRLPNDSYPSDHLSLVLDVKLSSL